MSPQSSLKAPDTHDRPALTGPVLMVEDLTVQSLFPQFAIKALAVAILTMAVGILYAFFVPTQASLFLSTLALISGS